VEVSNFGDIETTFLERVHSVVWCTMATVDTQGRPRSRIIHPIWEGQVGWVTTRRTGFKGKHLALHPYVSLAYSADIAKPVYVDCRAEWDDTLETKQHVSDLYRLAPPPLGYEVSTIFDTIDHPNFGVLRFTPWRIELGNFPGTPQVWHNAGV